VVLGLGANAVFIVVDEHLPHSTTAIRQASFLIIALEMEKRFNPYLCAGIYEVIRMLLMALARICNDHTQVTQRTKGSTGVRGYH